MRCLCGAESRLVSTLQNSVLFVGLFKCVNLFSFGRNWVGHREKEFVMMIHRWILFTHLFSLTHIKRHSSFMLNAYLSALMHTNKRNLRKPTKHSHVFLIHVLLVHYYRLPHHTNTVIVVAIAVVISIVIVLTITTMGAVISVDVDSLPSNTP